MSLTVARKIWISVISTWIYTPWVKKRPNEYWNCNDELVISKIVRKIRQALLLKTKCRLDLQGWLFQQNLLFKDNLHLVEKANEKKIKYAIKESFHKINTNKKKDDTPVFETNIFLPLQYNSAFKARDYRKSTATLLGKYNPQPKHPKL